ncbi:unnamed protein product [Sphagnum balticum]
MFGGGSGSGELQDSVQEAYKDNAEHPLPQHQYFYLETESLCVMFLNLHLLGAPFDKQGLAGKIAVNKAADQWQPGWLPLVFELSENELEA